MEHITLGRTGLEVSVMGLGCGGHSRLGISTGKTEAEAVAIVRKALDLGVNFIDTAENYKTERFVGQGIQGRRRDSVILSTKVSPRKEGRLRTGAEFKAEAEEGLRRLGTDSVDVLHVHGVSAEDYPYVREELIPALLELRDEGKIRFPGITEAFAPDPTHRMLSLALQDDCWDVMMVGFNILNQSARERVFSVTQAKGIGVLCMFAVRRALSQPQALRDQMRDLTEQGLIDDGAYDPDDPLGFLLADRSAENVPDAAYRFCRYEPGVHVVLSGTGNVEHLEANAASLVRPPLPPQHLSALHRLFLKVDSVSGN